MSYQVIARKYRPQRFSDVVGQEHVTRTLANAIQFNRIGHAYLFCGPRGTGKTTVARIFAKCLNCTGGPKVDFDEADEKCREIAEGRSLDVLEIDGASNNGVEQVRELRDTVKFLPASSKFKIFIIDEVHMLSTAAFNALLKTLEEPPEHVKFMFATTDPERVLPTILSRCQRFDLRRIPTSLIANQLAHIATLEKITIDSSTLHTIARSADGGMRDAESALDQLISFCGTTIQEADALMMFGLTSQAQIMNVSLAILNADAPTLLREVDALARNGKDLGRLIADVLGHFRSLLVFQVSQGDLSLLEVSEAETEMLKQQANRCSRESLTQIMDVLSQAESRFRDAANPRIFLEVSLLKALEARQAISLDSVLEQLRQLRGQGGHSTSEDSSSFPKTSASASSSAPPSVVSASSALTSPSNKSAAPGPGPASLASATSTSQTGHPELPALWPQLLDAVGRVSQFTRSYLLEAFPLSFQNRLFTIGFDPQFGDHIDLVNNTKNIELLQTKLRELGHPGTQVKFVRASMPAEWSNAVASTVSTAAPASEPSVVEPTASTTVEAPASKTVPASKAKSPEASLPSNPTQPPSPLTSPARLDPAEFKNDPLIQQALDVFKGRIIEVRA